MKTEILKFKDFKLKRGVKKLYQVDNLTVEFRKLQIVGPNGSGKSSLLKHLDKYSKKYFKAKVGYVNQHPMLISRLDIKSNCELLLTTDYSDLLAEYMTIFPELDSRKKVAKLSGGQIQVLNILFNLHEEKELYFIDEPYNNLDQNNRQYIENKLINLDANLIIIAHGYQLNFCDTTLVIDNQTIEERHENPNLTV